MVTHAVAERVVDLLQPVEVDEEEDDPGSGPPRPVERLLAESLQAAAVVETGQLVDRSQLLELAGLFGELGGLVGEPAFVELLPLGDVARDPEQADDLARAVAERDLRRRDPGLAPVLPGLALLDPDERLAGLHQPLLVRERLARVLLGEEVEVAPPDRLGRDRPARAGWRAARLIRMNRLLSSLK